MSIAIDGWQKRDPLADPQSLEFRFRARRFERIRPLIEAALARKDHVEILDLGGTEAYWSIAAPFLAPVRDRLTITLVNNEEAPAPRGAMFRSLLGNACDPQLFAGQRFDLVHSNSVIEHVGDETQMRAFADTVRRLSDRYFVQTPNYWFPLEPHFRVLGFQYLPLGVRAALMKRFNLGFFPRARSAEEAYANVRDIRLLDAAMMARFFPEAEIAMEKVAGLNKSIMAIRG